MKSTQKIIKYLAMAFAICLIILIFASICGLTLSLNGILTDTNKDDIININEFPNTSNILNIDIASSRLKIVESDKLKVETNNKYITSKLDNNKLSVKERKHTIFMNYDKNEVIVYIPKNTTFDKVYVENGAGIINIENLTTKELKLELGAGRLEIKKLTTLVDTNIEGGAGEVEINNASLNNLDLDVGVGKFTLNTTLTGKSEINAGVGELNINLLDKSENYTIHTDSGIGTINVDNTKVNGSSTYGNGVNKIDIDGGVGNINIKFNER